jgi:four helix bundle protein
MGLELKSGVGVMRRNRNRGYKKLTVWNDAIHYYAMTCEIFRPFPFDLKRVVSQQIASVDSVHRNIAEGYCRRSIKEYLNFLNIALGSLGESVSGLSAFLKSKQISKEKFEKLDALAYKMENGLLKLVESLERKRDRGNWIDSLVVKESNAIYGKKSPVTSCSCWEFQHSTTPVLQCLKITRGAKFAGGSLAQQTQRR